jgi:hypothetical protein
MAEGIEQEAQHLLDAAGVAADPSFRYEAGSA